MSGTEIDEGSGERMELWGERERVRRIERGREKDKVLIRRVVLRFRFGCGRFPIPVLNISR